MLPWKKYPTNWNIFSIEKIAQSKQSSKRRKFAQSGHPAVGLHWRGVQQVHTYHETDTTQARAKFPGITFNEMVYE
jgi:hypothetical protein